MMSPYSFMIDGNQVFTDKTFDVINPATGEAFAQVCKAELAHLDQAVDAAQKAFKSWSRVDDKVRQQAVMDIAASLESHFEELTQLLTKEQGKPLKGHQGVGSGYEVGGSIAWCRSTAKLVIPVDVVQDNDAARIEVHRKPLGVIGSITPWNFPLLIAIWHVIPAIRSGNTVVIKPSDLTPLTTLRFVELANEILPPGVLNVVTGQGEMGRAISAHPGIRKIVFTGSTATGKNIMNNAAFTMKRLTLELGGNDAGIVLPDVDIKTVAPKLFAAALMNNGQTCIALKRMYVHEDIYEELCAALAQIANSVTTGNGMENVDFGPVQNKSQYDRIKELTQSAKEDGGRFLSGGEAIDGPGYFFPVTLVADLAEGSRLVDEEPFGPIVPIIKYSSEEEAIERANASLFGLGGSIWSNDLEKARELAGRLECGTAWINGHAGIQPNAPFGGVKESGFGVEFSDYGLEEYMSLQTVNQSKK